MGHSFHALLCRWFFPFASTGFVSLHFSISLFVYVEFLMSNVVGNTLGILGSPLSYAHFFADDWFLFHSHPLFTQGHADFLVTPDFSCGLLLSRYRYVLHHQLFSRNRHLHGLTLSNYLFPQANFAALHAFFKRPQNFAPELNPVILRCRAHVSAAPRRNRLKSALPQVSTASLKNRASLVHSGSNDA